MNRHVQRLSALVLTLAVLLGTVPATFAASDGSFGGDRGDGGFSGGSHGGGFRKGTFGSASTRFLSPVKGYTAAQNGDTCAKSEDSFHVAQVKSRGGGTDSIGAYSSGICLSCGASFKVYESDVQRSCGENTEKLPSQEVDSEGYLYWTPKVCHVEIAYNKYHANIIGDKTYRDFDWDFAFSNGVLEGACGKNDLSKLSFEVSFYTSDAAPVTGNYTFVSRGGCTKFLSFSDGIKENEYLPVKYATPVYYPKGKTVDKFCSCYVDSSSQEFFSFFRLTYSSMQVKIEPLSGLIDSNKDSTYGTSTRPGSSDFGFYFGDDNKLLSDNTANIVNEVNNSYYNPITNTTNNYNNWSYDYSSRTYTVNNTDNSTTTTITYGDEYVTIKEGDTVYNIYYYVQQDGSQTPATCQHEYTSAVTTAATCTGAGVMTYTCSKCQHSYTEAIPAKGHTWQVAQTVDPEQDAEGNVTKKGYTLYRCSVCATEYKDETGTGPPSTPGDSGGGNSILDKLGQLIGSVFGGILEVLGGIISKVLDALISLVQMLTDKLTLLVENILKIFDTLPAIFSGFLGFLGAVFGFLPEELLLVLEFGLIAVVFVGILLLIFKR